VIKIDPAERRIGLSVRALDEDFSEAEIKKVADQVSKEIDGAMVGMGEAFDDALSVLEENVKKKDAGKKPEEKKDETPAPKKEKKVEPKVEAEPKAEAAPKKEVEAEVEEKPAEEAKPEVEKKEEDAAEEKKEG
jgi:outer membrane biosynthesis protein TonB